MNASSKTLRQFSIADYGESGVQSAASVTETRERRPDVREPRISVVVTSMHGPAELRDCLHSVLRQSQFENTELLVVSCADPQKRRDISNGFPQAIIVPVEEGLSKPAMWLRGAARATGDIVAFLGEHCVAAPDWLAAIQRSGLDEASPRRGFVRAISGAVENGRTDRAMDWAVYFLEYAPFMPPVPDAAVESICGPNSAFDRTLLAAVTAESSPDVWDWFLHKRLRETGATFSSSPGMVVFQKKQFTLGGFLRMRFHYGRSFAAERLKARSRFFRLLYAAATAGLPVLLLLRITQTVFRKRRNRAHLLHALPWLVLFLFGGALGESLGALCGEADSRRKAEW